MPKFDVDDGAAAVERSLMVSKAGIRLRGVYDEL